MNGIFELNENESHSENQLRKFMNFRLEGSKAASEADSVYVSFENKEIFQKALQQDEEGTGRLNL